MYDYKFINDFQLRNDLAEFQHNSDVVNLNLDNLAKDGISFTTLLHIILSSISETEYQSHMCSDEMWIRIEVVLSSIRLNNLDNDAMFHYWSNISNIITRWRDGEVFIPAYDSDISIYSEENLKTLKYYCEKILKTDYEILTDGNTLKVTYSVSKF